MNRSYTRFCSFLIVLMMLLSGASVGVQAQDFACVDCFESAGMVDDCNNEEDAVVCDTLQTGDLPDAVDNSKSPYFPAIGDQKSLNACVSYAVAHYQFTYTMNKALGVPTTPENTFSVKWLYNLANFGANEGSTAFTVYKILKQHGCALNVTFPYDGVDYKSWSTDGNVWREAMKYRLSEARKFSDIGLEDSAITSCNDTDLNEIKTALNNGDVLKFSSYIYSWEYGNLKENGNVPENDKYPDEQFVRQVAGNEGEHGMVIVGYNNNLWCDINNNDLVDDGEMGALKIANSWSEAYGNKGFMWIAYDALNKVSVVEQAESAQGRQAAIKDIYRIEVCTPQSEKEIYLKFTLNTANRADFSVSFSAEKNGSEFESVFLDEAGYNTQFNYCAFDGSNKPCDAAFLYSLSDLDPELTAENFEQYNFRITIKDGEENSVPLVVKDISLVNEYTGEEYVVNGDYPISLDGSEFTATVKESTKSNAVVYYIGYDNPVLNYRTGKGAFESVYMEENPEKTGALYKYVIYDVEGEVELYFSNSAGDVDDNGEVYYKAQKGLNFYYTKGVREPLTVYGFGFSNGTPDVNKRCLFDIQVMGGYEPYQYRYVIEHLDTGAVREFDFGYNYERSPYSFYQEGTYRITVEVMDYAKEVASVTKDIEVLNHPFEITDVTISSGVHLVSKEIEFKTVTDFESIVAFGSNAPKAKYVIKDSDGRVCLNTTVKSLNYDAYIKFSETVCSFIPARSGVYTLVVSAEDFNKEYSERTITFEVLDMLTGDADCNGKINIKDATTIQKFIANLISADDFDSSMADCDGNETVNIKDATAIQYYVADMPQRSGKTGEVIEYTGTEEYPTEEPTLPPAEEPTLPPAEEPTLPPAEEPVQPEPVVNNKVTFTNSFGWDGTMYCYYWSDENKSMTSWPGEPMINAGANDYGETLYTFDVPKEATCIIFTNGSVQTVDIPYGGSEVRYYPINSITENCYNVKTW